MDMEFKIYQISEEGKECYVPKKEKLTIFECWAMRKAYCQLYDQFGPKVVCDRKIDDNIVWNGGELYNVEYQATKDHGQVRLWMTEKNDLMYEICYDDQPNKLFLVH